MVGVVEAGGDPEAEEVGGVEVGVVEGVDVGAEGFAEGSGELARVVDGGDGGEVRLEGGEAVRFDGGLVHVGGVEVGDLALLGAGGGVGFGGFFDDGGDALVDDVGEGGEAGDAGAVGGDLGAGDVGAVGVAVEVVAGEDGGVHVGGVDAVGVTLCVSGGERSGESKGSEREGVDESHARILAETRYFCGQRVTATPKGVSPNHKQAINKGSSALHEPFGGYVYDC